MTAREFATIFEGIATLDSGVPGDELGFVWGDPDIEVTGVGCMWCLQTESIEQCVEHRFNLIISHERSWLPVQDSPWYQCPDSTALFSQMTRSELLCLRRREVEEAKRKRIEQLSRQQRRELSADEKRREEKRI